MALLQFNAAQVEPQKTNFDPLPPGNYVAQVIESDLKPLASGKGDALNLTLQILEGQYINRKVWARLNIRHENAQAQQIAQSQLSALCHAVGVINLNDSAQLHGKPVRIRVKLRPAEGQYAASNDVNGFEAVAGGAIPLAAAPGRPSFAAPAAAPAAAAPVAPWARKAA
ncbi:DUF669 domain-containing protein [Variovorax sp. GT1P44]|uniref:DUF669 domain-containing protein n=1 Tax=Variovorax sp. GT1P44 TaxID=3443742 RepID=UPI003F478FF5